MVQATLKLGDVTYDDFIAQPFRNCASGVVFEVAFHRTDDPYFYDKADRERIKPTLEEEMAYDDAAAGTDPIADLKEWVVAYRLAHNSSLLCI